MDGDVFQDSPQPIRPMKNLESSGFSNFSDDFPDDFPIFPIFPAAVAVMAANPRGRHGSFRAHPTSAGNGHAARHGHGHGHTARVAACGGVHDRTCKAVDAYEARV